MRGTVASARDHPLAVACLLVVVGAGLGYAVAGPATGKLEETLVVAATTLIFGALLGGAVKFLLDDVQRLRERRQEQARFVRQVLDDLKSVYDRVERVRILVSAHRSALTYGNEMRDLIDSAVQLRNVTRALAQTSGVLEDRADELEAAVERMTDYLESLIDEFEDCYKPIADKQALYEAQAKRARDAEPPLALPRNEAWDELSRLPRLAEFRGAEAHPPFDYDEDFRKALTAATSILRTELARLAG